MTWLDDMKRLAAFKTHKHTYPTSSSRSGQSSGDFVHKTHYFIILHNYFNLSIADLLLHKTSTLQEFLNCIAVTVAANNSTDHP